MTGLGETARITNTRRGALTMPRRSLARSGIDELNRSAT
jgi:hypothetical protein